MLEGLTQRVDRLAGFDSLLAALDGPNGRGQIDGLTATAKSLAIARVYQRSSSQMLVITYSQEQAQRLAADFDQFGIPSGEVFLMPAIESRRSADDITDHAALGERISALSALVSGKPCVVIGTPEAVFQRTGPPDDLMDSVFTLKSGESVNIDRLANRLVEIGYDAESTVSRPGQFSRRGGIFDIYSSTAESPVRIELFGDDIESLRKFDVSTQRSTNSIPEIVIAPAREIMLTDQRVNQAVMSIRNAVQDRKLQLAKEKNREAFDRINDR